MRPKWLTKKQSEIMCLIYPGPVGRGLTVSQACKELDISRNAGYSRLRYFKKRFPMAWNRYQQALDFARKQKKWIDAEKKISYSRDLDEIMKEKF